MTSQLELYQRGLLDLVKNRPVSSNDPYLRSLADSRELAMLSEIAIWWRAFQIEAQCRFTARLLKRLGCFEASVTTYFNENPTSPFVEELSDDFLLSLHRHPEPLLRSVSQFERAFLRVRGGSTTCYEVLWDRHPDLVILALEEHRELPPAESEFIYRMKIAPHLSGLISCSREAAA